MWPKPKSSGIREELGTIVMLTYVRHYNVAYSILAFGWASTRFGRQKKLVLLVIFLMKMFYMFVTMVFYVCCKMKITTILIVLMMLIITMVSMLYQALAAEATDCSVSLVTVIFLMLMEMVNVTFFCNGGDDGDGDENAIRGSSARGNYCSTSLVHVGATSSVHKLFVWSMHKRL